MPYYSVYDSYPIYQRLTTADIITDFPTRVYKLKDTATKIISIRNIISSEYMHLGKSSRKFTIWFWWKLDRRLSYF